MTTTEQKQVCKVVTTMWAIINEVLNMKNDTWTDRALVHLSDLCGDVINITYGGKVLNLIDSEIFYKQLVQHIYE